MLVLTRKTGEEFVINGNIRVKIVHVKGQKVRVGVEAPENINVLRSEIQNIRDAFSSPMLHQVPSCS